MRHKSVTHIAPDKSWPSSWASISSRVANKYGAAEVADIDLAEAVGVAGEAALGGLDPARRIEDHRRLRRDHHHEIARAHRLERLHIPPHPRPHPAVLLSLDDGIDVGHARGTTGCSTERREPGAKRRASSARDAEARPAGRRSRTRPTSRIYSVTAHSGCFSKKLTTSRTALEYSVNCF